MWVSSLSADLLRHLVVSIHLEIFTAFSYIGFQGLLFGRVYGKLSFEPWLVTLISF